MPTLNVPTDQSPILAAADLSDREIAEKNYGGTGTVYPRVTADDSAADIMAGILVTRNQPQPRRRMSKRAFMILIIVVNITANVLMNVSLPVFAGTMDEVGGDTFVILMIAALFFPVIFFYMSLIVKATINPKLRFRPAASIKILFIMGFATTLNGILVVFASPPSRTAPYLQGILSTMLIPYTVIARLIILRKGISLRRAVCTVVVVVGLFITVEPEIWGIDQSKTSQSGSILWPCVFALGFLPAAISGVICEKELQATESDSLTFIMWTQVFQLFTILPMFWVDFLPGFGMAKSFSAFHDNVQKGFACSFSSAASCNGLAGKLWLFLIGYTVGNLFQFLLIEYAEGAVYAVIVQSMVTPIATLFWTLFKFVPKDNHFYWSPDFNETTCFTIAGLAIIVPSVVMYNYFSNLDAKEKLEKEDKIRDVIVNEMKT